MSKYLGIYCQCVTYMLPRNLGVSTAWENIHSFHIKSMHVLFHITGFLFQEKIRTRKLLQFD